MAQQLVQSGIILFLLLVFLSLCSDCVLPVILYFGLCYLSLPELGDPMVLHGTSRYFLGLPV
jgi:hypothetical protein